MARGVAGYNYVRRVRAGKGGGGYDTTSTVVMWGLGIRGGPANT